MTIEAHVRAFLTIVFLSPSGQCNYQRPAPGAVAPDCLTYFVAIHLRQTDIQQYDVRIEALEHLQRFQPVMSLLDVVAVQLEQLLEALGRIRVIIHDQDASSAMNLIRSARIDRRFLYQGTVSRQSRQPNDELGAFALARAVSLDGALVHLDQAFDQRQPNAQTNAIRFGVNLRKHLEDFSELVGRYADARIANGNDRQISLASNRHGDHSATLSIFAGVIEQVLKDLGKPNRVSVQINGPGRERGIELMAVLIE